MKNSSGILKSVIITLFCVILILTVIYEFYALAEISNMVGKCRKLAKTANVEYEIPVKYGYKLSNFDIHDEKFTVLCGCIKFSQCSNVGECLIFTNENRTLIASQRYSSPIYYSYECNPENRQYSDEQCINEIKRIALRCIPKEISGMGLPEIISFETEGGRFNAVFSFGEESGQVTISLRNDTLSTVYFDARDIYFK